MQIIKHIDYKHHESMNISPLLEKIHKINMKTK